MASVEYMSVNEAAAWLGCHRQTLHAWVRQGRIEAYKLGRLTRFKVQDLRDLMARPNPDTMMRAGLRAERQAAMERAAMAAHRELMAARHHRPTVIRD